MPAPRPRAACLRPSYQIAIRLARSGATREEMMASCGVTRQEAELMQRLACAATSTTPCRGELMKARTQIQ